MWIVANDKIATTGNYWLVAGQSNNPGAGIGALLTIAQAGIGSYPATVTHVLLEIGSNDVAAMPTEAAMKSDYNDLLDLFAAKWSGVEFGLMQIGRRDYETECDTYNGWLADIVAGRADAFLGPNQLVFLENGDDYTTYTDDGNHPNDAGQTLTAHEWAPFLT